ncbi:transcriptional regulator [Kribbella amoyensis]|uniref:Transcriptional regulator n=1 Tax=Kribbella amoyensis TaxID=996641 RepID=A0A561B993_9ACTN|nr:winged helix-turn-helix domain-containing protein [Kribbella amoyensis]TWD75328.1 transcriptional regulator [Kribbella amoyensis]
MERLPDSSLIIGVATSTAERVHLTRLLSGAEALLLVSSADQARAFLDLTTAAGPVGPVAELVAQVGPADEDETDYAADVVELPAGLRLDDQRRVVRWKDREVPLTRLEHDFLTCLVRHPGQVWTYQKLHHAVWGNEHLGHGSHIHSVVKRLRQKLAELGAAVTIHAVRGVGFHLLPAA